MSYNVNINSIVNASTPVSPSSISNVLHAVILFQYVIRMNIPLPIIVKHPKMIQVMEKNSILFIRVNEFHSFVVSGPVAQRVWIIPLDSIFILFRRMTIISRPKRVTYFKEIIFY